MKVVHRFYLNSSSTLDMLHWPLSQQHTANNSTKYYCTVNKPNRSYSDTHVLYSALQKKASTTGQAKTIVNCIFVKELFNNNNLCPMKLTAKNITAKWKCLLEHILTIKNSWMNTWQWWVQDTNEVHTLSFVPIKGLLKQVNLEPLWLLPLYAWCTIPRRRCN